MLGIVAITTPICAMLPNATTVMPLAPLIPPLTNEIGVDFVPLLILMVFMANSSGLLTLVGDPATFIVGSSINITFVDYLKTLSLGGAIEVLVIVAMVPFLFKNLANSTFKSGLFTASYHSVSQGPDSRIHYLSIGLSVLCSR